MARDPHSPITDVPPFLICPTRDGSNTVFSRQFDAAYHSMHGAVSESRHVFIQHGLASLSKDISLSVLEFGFGTGLNALLALAFGRKNNLRVEYTGLETIRLPEAVIRHLEYPGYIGHPELSDTFFRMHAGKSFSDVDFSFSLLDKFPVRPATFSCIFFDAFAPGTQPECWSPDVFEALSTLTAPGGMVVTYCAQGEVRRRMRHAGYLVERLPGAPGKREMLRGRKPLFP